jgi:beta-glucosidase
MGLWAEEDWDGYPNGWWTGRIESEGKDRSDLRLPGAQDSLVRQMVATGKPVILVLLNGGPVSVDWAAKNVPAIIEAGYPGEEGGNAIADVIFGDYNPAGRMPITVYSSTTALPDMTNFAMIGSGSTPGRTYRYFNGTPLYPFGHGLSYTTFTYNNLAVSPASAATNQPVNASIDVTNSGTRDGDEVVQVYVTEVSPSAPAPIRSLAAFKRVAIPAGGTRTVSFTLQPKNFSIVDAAGKRFVEPGNFTIVVGGGQPIAVDGKLPPAKSGAVTLTGSVFAIGP